MDFTNNPRGAQPQRPASGVPPRPAPQRRVFNDFAVRPAAPRPVVPPQPAPGPLPSTAPVLGAKPSAFRPQHPQPAPTAHAPHMSPAPVPHPPARVAAPASLLSPVSASIPAAPLRVVPTTAPAQPASATPAAPAQAARPYQIEDTAEPKQRIRTGHAGLVGLAVFVVLTALMLSPLLPGKILDGLPGSSQSSSSGDQALACATTLGTASSTTVYDSKAGSPINYNYATTTTQKATCDGKLQTAITGHTSQFSPLGLAIDIATALVVAIAISKIWRKVFGDKD